MKPTIKHLAELTLVGMSFYGDPFDTSDAWTEENQIGRLWTRFMTFLGGHAERILHQKRQNVAYEVHIYHEETQIRGVFEIFVGVEVEALENVPIELLVKVLPSSDYAVFTLHGEEIFADWMMQIENWLTDSGYQRSHSFSIQYYDDRFKGVDRIAESTLDVYMPVRKISTH